MCKQLGGRGSSKRMRVDCQVCGVDLVSIKVKDYCVKKRVCPQHLQADAVVLPGHTEHHRFCHQCGRFEPLTCFDGVRRSCRNRLLTRRVRAPKPSDAGGSSSSTGGRTLQRQGSVLFSGSIDAPDAFASMEADADSDPTPQLAAAAAAAEPGSSPRAGWGAASPRPAYSGSANSGGNACAPQQQQQACYSIGAGDIAAGMHGMLMEQHVQQRQRNHAQAYHGSNAAAAAMQFDDAPVQFPDQQTYNIHSAGAAAVVAAGDAGDGSSGMLGAASGLLDSKQMDAAYEPMQNQPCYGRGNQGASAMQGMNLPSPQQQQQQQQQQGFAGPSAFDPPPAAGSLSSAPAGGFEDFLHALMQDELSKVMHQEQQQGPAQQQQQQQTHWPVPQPQQLQCGNSPAVSAVHPGALQVPGTPAPNLLSAGGISAALLNPNRLAVQDVSTSGGLYRSPAEAQRGSTAGGLYRSDSTAAAGPMDIGAAPSALARTSNSMHLMQAGGVSAGADLNSTASTAALAVAEETAMRRQQLLQQARELLEEERRLRDASSPATAAATGGLASALLGGMRGIGGGMYSMSHNTSPVLPACMPAGMQLAGDGMHVLSGFMGLSAGAMSDGMVQHPQSVSALAPSTGDFCTLGATSRVPSAPPSMQPFAGAGQALAQYGCQQQQQQQHHHQQQQQQLGGLLTGGFGAGGMLGSGVGAAPDQFVF